tara:strand:+ start:298 stop:711 length:414 start_codon:yes stop_codon:yes gene_type:complete
MKLALVKNQDNTFSIAYNSDYEKAKKIKQGEVREYETKNKRNYQFHKKYFAMINLVFDNQEIYNNIEDLRHDLTIEAGFFTRRENLDGDEIKKPLSISFGSMDEYKFNEYYSAVLNVVIRHFGHDKEALENELIQHF